MSSLKMTFSLASLILIFAFVAVMPVMAHEPDNDATFDGDHDGKDNATPTDPAPTEVNHTHRAAPTVTSIELVDVKITTGAKSTVDGTSVTLVDDVYDSATTNGTPAAVTAITDFTAAAATAGQFRIKITFSEDVYTPSGQASNYGDPLADAALAADLIAVGNITDVAASKAAPNVQITDLTVSEVVRMSDSSKVFLATVTVPAANLVSVPMDVWIGVSANAAYSKGKFSAGQTTDGKGNAAFSSSTPFTIVKMFDDPGDTTAPMMRITPPDMLDSMSDVVFTIDVDEALVDKGPSALQASDFAIVGGDPATATLAKVAKLPTGDDAPAMIGKKAVVERYTLTVTPDAMGDDSVTITLDTDAVADAAGNSVASVMATYDVTAPMVTITSAAGTGTMMGKVVFTIDFSEALASPLSIGDLRVSNADPLGVNDLAEVEGTMAAPLPMGVAERYTLTVTPTDATMPNVLDLAAGSVMDMAENMVDGQRATFTPAPPDAPAAPTNLTATAGDGKVTLKWTVAAGASYQYRKKSGTADFMADGSDYMDIAATALMDVTGDTTMKMFEVTGLTGGTEYTFQVRVKAADPVPAGMDSASVMATPTTPTTGPSATQIGSKDYLVFVPANHDASALPTGLATSTVADMPNLADFFRAGGTIDIVVTGKTNHQVIITEIMVAEDLGKRGGTGMNRPAASQWIELYNATDAHINISDITFTFTPGYPAPAAPTDATDRFSNTVVPGWSFADTFGDALSGQTGLNASGAAVVTKMFKSLRRSYKKNANDYDDDKKLQDAGTVIGNGWDTRSWKLTADSRIFLAGRVGTAGLENRPTVFTPAEFTPPAMNVTINEVANRNDDGNEWIELKGPAGTNMKKFKISIVTGYDKTNNTGTESTIYQFPDNDDTKMPAGGVMLLTDQNPADNELAADLENGVPKPVRYKIVTLAALPNSGDFLLVLRNTGGTIEDVAGHLAGLDDDDPYTKLWPLKGNVGRISAKNKLAGGNVYKRHRAIQGYSSNKDNGDEPAFEGAGFTGIGYDRLVNAGNKEHHGTPGYPNGAQIGAGAEATGNVVISEVMYGDGSGNLPQWIEIHNRSDTNGVDLHNWRIYIINHNDNADGSKFAGKILDEVWLRNVKIPQNQTALVVAHAGRHSTNLPAHRILNLRRDKPILSSKGFSLRLEANSHEGDAAKRQAGDMVGNLAEADPKNRRADHQAFMEPAWVLPTGIDESGARVSIARRGSAKVMAKGTDAYAWLSSADDTRKYNAVPYYGRPSDIGTPGHTSGGVLPVQLSKFRPELLDDGSIVIRWITESELNNAGFNILRSETRDGEFTKINTSLIAGQGTTSERTTYSWVDKSAKPNVVYYYQIQDVSLDGQVQTLRMSRLKGDVSPAGKITTTWGDIKALQ
ncbi:hypothetical protein C6503_02875 [Candidatus Poribacteria bacterium]|nr:MAG: hypothetical protein C6503_02875 [Candidatus Poribacteria bacterium]